MVAHMPSPHGQVRLTCGVAGICSRAWPLIRSCFRYCQLCARSFSMPLRWFASRAEGICAEFAYRVCVERCLLAVVYRPALLMFPEPPRAVVEVTHPLGVTVGRGAGWGRADGSDSCAIAGSGDGRHGRHGHDAAGRGAGASPYAVTGSSSVRSPPETAAPLMLCPVRLLCTNTALGGSPLLMYSAP
jgi:hypothetical protein